MAGQSSEKLERTIRLLHFLALKTPGGGATLGELVDKCEVSVRQIYRDLDTIDNTGAVQVIRPAKGQKVTGRYLLDEAFSWRIGPEAAAVMFLSILRQKGGPLAIGAGEVKDVLVAALCKNKYGDRNQEFELLKDRIHVVEEQLLDKHKNGEILLKLVAAIKENKTISIDYLKAATGEQSNRIIHPYGLTCKHNNWYLVGFCEHSVGDRTFRLDCINSVYVLQQKFEFPPDFNLKDYFGDSWGIYSSDEKEEIVIKVEPALAYRFRLIAYHPSQQLLQENTDGSVVVGYRTSGLFEFTAWLLQWGELVEILEPASLRQQMREKLGMVLGKYGG